MNPNSLSAYILSKTLDIDPTLFDAEVRKLSKKGSLGNVIGKQVLGKITPDAIKKLSETVKKFQGRKVRKGRAIIQKRNALMQRKRGGSSSIDFILNQLGRDKSYGVGEENLIKALEASEDPKLLQQFWDIKENSPQEKLSLSSNAGKGFIKSLQQNKGFIRAYNQTITGDSGLDQFRRGGFSGGDSFMSGDQSFSRPRTSKRRSSSGVEASDSSLELQEATYNLMKMNFKETNDLLKKILSVIQNFESGSGGGILPGMPNPKTNPKGKIKNAITAGAAFMKKAVKVAPLAVAGVQAFGDVSQINKAEQAGIYTKEQASALRKRAMLRRTSAAVGGLAAGALGTATAGPVGSVAGGVVGYNFGDEIGKSLGDSIFGSEKDRGSGYLAAVASLESSLNTSPNATGTTSAKGLYQFTDSTWNRLNEKYKKGYALGGAADPRLDPKKATEMMKLLSNENQASLEKNLGRSVTDTELYAAHFMGPGGASKLLTADASKSSVELFPKAAASNKAVFYNKDGTERSVGDLRGLIAKKYAKAAASVGAVPDMTLPRIPEIAAAQIISSADSTQQPVTDSDMKTFAQQKVVQQNAQAHSSAQIAAAVSKLSKEGAVAKNSKINPDGSPKYIPVGGGGGGGPNQSAFNDINSIHMMDGLLLNILTD